MASIANASNPISSTRNRRMRAFISKKSRVPWVFSPSDTTRASPTMSRRKPTSELGRERCEPSNGTAFRSIHAVASAGTGGGLGSAGTSTGVVASPPHDAKERSAAASAIGMDSGGHGHDLGEQGLTNCLPYDPSGAEEDLAELERSTFGYVGPLRIADLTVEGDREHRCSATSDE